MIFLLIILIILLIGLSILTWKLYKVGQFWFDRCGKLDFFIELMRVRVEDCVKQMKDIDMRGAFESDDEVGGVFRELASMVTALNFFLNMEYQNLNDQNKESEAQE